MIFKTFIQLTGRTLFIFAFCYFMPQKVTHAQRHSIENLRFEVMQNDVVLINYDLLSDGRNRRFDINLTLHQESNRFFSYEPRRTIGDVGTGRFEGRNNTIVWSLGHELPEDFSPNPFVDDYYFTLEARRKSRAGWWLFFALVGGAAYYFVYEY